jgi:hypothetical protein
MTVWVEQTEQERVIHGAAQGLLVVPDRVRLLGHAHDGVHVRPTGRLIASGIIGKWVQIDTGASLYTTGAISAQPVVDEGGLLDIRGTLSVVRLRREQPGTILLAVGARYNDLVLRPDGTLTPRDGIEGGNAPASAPRYRIVSGGREPVLVPAPTPTLP